MKRQAGWQKGEEECNRLTEAQHMNKQTKTDLKAIYNDKWAKQHIIAKRDDEYYRLKK